MGRPQRQHHREVPQRKTHINLPDPCSLHLLEVTDLGPWNKITWYIGKCLKGSAYCSYVKF
jgi:hypothetical protein